MNWLLRRLRRTAPDATDTEIAEADSSGEPTAGGIKAAPSSPGSRIAATEIELERMKGRLRATEENLRRADAQRRHLEHDLNQAQARCEQEVNERRRLISEMEQASQGRLWAWAEEEVHRLQDSLKKTRDRLYQAEEELHDARSERDFTDRRVRNAEDETQRLRDELHELERTVAAGQTATPVTRGNGKAAAATREPPPVARVEKPVGAAVQNGNAERLALAGMEVTVDMNAALAGVDGDTELLRTLARAFHEDAPLLLGDLRLALDDADWEIAASSLRTLRGALASLGAVNARQALQRLEASVDKRDIVEAEDAYVAVQLEIERLRPVLATLRGR